MLNKKLLLLPLLAIPVLGMTSCLGDIDYHEIFDLVKTESGYTIAKYKNQDIHTLEIPEKIDDIAVTGIGKEAFKDNTSLAIVSIPSIVTIEDGAFQNCSKLIDVINGNALTSVGNNSFANCTNLSSFDYVYEDLIVGDEAFINCTNLFDIDHSDMNSIGRKAFFNCDALTYVDINGCSVAQEAFANCDNLLMLNLDGVTLTGSAVFKDALSLKSLNCVNTIALPNETFKNNVSLSNINIKDVGIIGAECFSGCKSIKNIDISSCTEIKKDAFKGCGNIVFFDGKESISDGYNENFNNNNEVYYNFNKFYAYEGLHLAILNNNDMIILDYLDREANGILTIEDNYNFDEQDHKIIGIANNAFKNTKLKEIHLSDTVTFIGKNAFLNAEDLIIYVKDKSVSDNYIPNWNCSRPVVYGSGSLVFSKNGLKYALDNNEIHIIGASDLLSKINIPNTVNYEGRDYPVVEIASSAFNKCKKLQEINIPGSVINIRSYAFNNCEALVKVVLDGKIKNIDPDAFKSCMNAIYYTNIETKPATWGENFNGGLPIVWGYQDIDLTLDGMDIAIGMVKEQYYAIILRYQSDRNVFAIPRSIAISDDMEVNITSIGGWAFKNNTMLSRVFIPSTIKYIGSYAFYNCPDLNIYVEDLDAGSDWDPLWNYENKPVTYGKTGL